MPAHRSPIQNNLHNPAHPSSFAEVEPTPRITTKQHTLVNGSWQKCIGISLLLLLYVGGMSAIALRTPPQVSVGVSSDALRDLSSDAALLISQEYDVQSLTEVDEGSVEYYYSGDASSTAHDEDDAAMGSNTDETVAAPLISTHGENREATGGTVELLPTAKRTTANAVGTNGPLQLQQKKNAVSLHDDNSAAALPAADRDVPEQRGGALEAVATAAAPEQSDPGVTADFLSVMWHEASMRFRARVQHIGKCYVIGSFATLAEAEEAVRAVRTNRAGLAAVFASGRPSVSCAAPNQVRKVEKAKTLKRSDTLKRQRLRGGRRVGKHTRRRKKKRKQARKKKKKKKKKKRKIENRKRMMKKKNSQKRKQRRKKGGGGGRG